MKTIKYYGLEKPVTIAKTILAIVPRLDEIRRLIFEKNNALAVNSMNNMYDTYGTAERILDNIDRADELHNLKIRVIEYVETMPEKLRRVTVLRFFKNQTAEQVAARIKTSARTVFRLQEQAIMLFAQNLGKIGIDFLKFKCLLKRNKWIGAEFERQGA